MAGGERLICESADLVDGQRGVRFEVDVGGVPSPAFAIRFSGRVYGYLNRCAHIPIELDWNPGQFFDFSGLYLICATHGATYLPETGRCVRGPCQRGGLRPLQITERDGNVYLMDFQPSYDR